MVIFSCTAMGFGKSMGLYRRLGQLREVEKMVLLLLGEITYRKEALPEALLRVSEKIRQPFSDFLKEVSHTASLYQGERFSGIFREQTEKYLKNCGMSTQDLEEFIQLGEYLGYMDITLQKNTTALYLEQLKKEREELVREMPVKRKLYQSMGVLLGIFLAILLV